MPFYQRLILLFTICIMLGCAQISLAQADVKGNSLSSPTAENIDAVNLNTATAEELQTLKGVGPSKAQAIISYRSEQGKFKSIEDLADVDGFSEKTVKKLLEQNPNRVVVLQ